MTMTTQFKNPNRITMKALAHSRGETVDSMLEAATYDSVAPACCVEGCEVEPDGHCEHGCPSVLLSAGLL
jgi:hypothetical protein